MDSFVNGFSKTTGASDTSSVMPACRARVGGKIGAPSINLAQRRDSRYHSHTDPSLTYNYLAIGDWGDDSGGQAAAAAGMGAVAEEIHAQEVMHHSPAARLLDGLCLTAAAASLPSRLARPSLAATSANTHASQTTAAVTMPTPTASKQTFRLAILLLRRFLNLWLKITPRLQQGPTEVLHNLVRELVVAPQLLRERFVLAGDVLHDEVQGRVKPTAKNLVGCHTFVLHRASGCDGEASRSRREIHDVCRTMVFEDALPQVEGIDLAL